MSESRHRVAIVGGGIAGLAAARRLQGGLAGAVTADGSAPAVLLESSGRLGGKIRTERFAGRPLDVGAEALLARAPEAIELCRALGLGEELVAPATDRAHVWTDRLHPLPPRLLAGAPGGARTVISTRTLSALGLARASFDLLAPSRPLRADVSIGELVEGRLGRQVLQRLIDPLLGGIHAGDCDELSVLAAAPQLAAALAKGHGLVRGLREMTAPTPAGTAPTSASAPVPGPAPAGAAPAPAFLGLRGGLESMVTALAASLEAVECRMDSSVVSLEPLPGGGARLGLADGSALSAEQLILALPAHACAPLLADLAPAAAAELSAIPYVSVATVALAYPRRALAGLPEGSGFMVQRGRGRTITACTFSSAKWPHLQGEGGVLKCSVGYAGDQRALALDDGDLIEAIRADLAAACAVSGEPESARVFRFEEALPQYRVGHLERIARIERELESLPGLRLCGAAYHGVGVSACVRDGSRAAEAALGALAGEGGDLQEAETDDLAALAAHTKGA